MEKVYYVIPPRVPLQLHQPRCTPKALHASFWEQQSEGHSPCSKVLSSASEELLTCNVSPNPARSRAPQSPWRCGGRSSSPLHMPISAPFPHFTGCFFAS